MRFGDTHFVDSTDLDTLIQDSLKIPGWCSRDQLLMYALLTILTRPDAILEIGVYQGRTSSLFRKMGYPVIGVDPLSVGYKLYECEITDEIRQEALRRISSLGVLLYDDVLDVPHSLLQRVNLAIIDGDHTFGSILRDWEVVNSTCPELDFVLFHDWCIPDVRKAVKNAVDPKKVHVFFDVAIVDVKGFWQLRCPTSVQGEEQSK
jgi:hypothetical protein